MASYSLLERGRGHLIMRQRYMAATGVILLLLSTCWLFSDGYSIIGFARQRLGETMLMGSTSAFHSRSLIPPKIWQIFLAKKQAENKPIDPDRLKDTVPWLALDTDYAYTLIGSAGADKFVQRHFANQPAIVETYERLPNVGMKSDLLRYLLLDVEGGVYTDTDTVGLKPIDDWVAPDLRDKVRLIIGVEFDRHDGGAWADIPHWLQFAQWTIAAAPGHPVFPQMVARVLRSVQKLSDKHDVPVHDLKPGNFEVINSTGPAAWTDVVFEYLQQHDPTLNTTRDMSFMTGRKLYGDVLVLNIDGFGTGQTHSHSTHDGSIPELAFMKQRFRGAWRGD